MSPLAQQQNKQTFNSNASNQQNLIVATTLTYTIAELYRMRHQESRVPNLSNRNVLAAISRQFNDHAKPFRPAGFINMDNFRRPPMNHQNRMIFRNGGSSGNHFMNGNGVGGIGERQRDKGQTNGSIQIRLSIKSDVKLCEAENAWKPSFLQKNLANEDDATELYKQVRSILNKLTAQNFGVLSEQFQQLRIDTKEKLVEVINLVFNKAVNEPNFSEGYAKLSQHLSHCSQQIDSSATERAYFKRTLITKCQIEFEQHVANKNTTEAALAPLMEKLKAFEEKRDLGGVAEMKALIAEQESVLRRRLVSTVRFIGELYKLDMLTTNIMNVCINMLITEATAVRASNVNQANEKLECLCKLLTTVGAKLERKPAAAMDTAKPQHLDLTNYMNQLKRIADNKVRNFKPSSRIKFMIMDVIELRTYNWVPKTTIGSVRPRQINM